MVEQDGQISGFVNNNKEKSTYADVVQKKQTKVALVRPKNVEAHGDSKKTKEKIKNNFDPKKVNIISVVNISKGGEIKEIATQKMGNDYPDEKK